MRIEFKLRGKLTSGKMNDNIRKCSKTHFCQKKNQCDKIKRNHFNNIDGFC